MTSTPPYAELHCHSAYSFLDGVSLPQELIQRAGELGYGTLALTDHNSVSGSMELAQAAGRCGMQAIHGAEVDLRSGRHLTLLVCDAGGWRNLCRIITLAHAHTRDGPGRRELGQAAIDLQAVLDHAEGLICLTGCAERSAVKEGARDEPTARRLLEAFGPERLRVELQRPYGRHDRARNRMLAALARRLGVACVATGDVHAHHRSRAELQDAFVALRHHTTLDASEPLRRGNFSHVLSTPAAMVSRFADHPEAVRETLALAERLSFDLNRDLGYRYPGGEDEGASRRLAELCSALLESRYGPGAISSRGPGGSRGPGEMHGREQGGSPGRERRSRATHARARAHARARLEQELHVIDELGLAGFFLLHYDMLELAREVACEVRAGDPVRALLAPGRGRGSSVSSIVCYLTGLSHIDPIENELALGRFLHEDLSGLPDIDLDFPRDIREALIPRVRERYGHDRVALVAAFPTFRERGAIRELGKVLGLPPGEIERMARSADHFGHGTERDIDALREGGARSGRWRWLARLAAQAYGLPRHLSQHSGGMIVATKPLIDCVPIVPAAMEGRQMVQWDKDSCSDAGFLKIDLLGLGMLSAVERCVQEIARSRSRPIDLSRIPFDDRPTYDAIRVADTVGVFQIESRAQMQSLHRTQPKNLRDLAIQVAIVRPGPIQGGAINPYIERLRRQRKDPSYVVPYEHPALEPALRETLGTIIFQDQVMQVAEDFAGFTPGAAETLRRAMSRKRSHADMRRQRGDFLRGAHEHVGADERTAGRVWEMVEGFAGFGFPKAHAAAFALLAYQSTWLRVHYGPEFLCSLLNEQPMGFYAPDSLVHEAERRGIPVLGLDVNASHVQCTVERVGGGAAVGVEEVGARVAGAGGLGVGMTDAGEGGAGAVLGVRLGLGYIKDVLASDMRELVAERERGGPYRALTDLAARSGAGPATLAQLAWSGACDRLVQEDASCAGADASAAGKGAWVGTGVEGAETGANASSRDARRRLALWQLGLATPAATTPGGAQTQLALALEAPATPRLRPLERWQRLIADYSTSGVTVGDHALAILRGRLSIPLLATSAQLAHLPSGCSVAVAGLVIARQRPGTAKGTMFLLFEDEHGTINLIVSKPVYERYRQLARAEPLLLARGRLERSEGVINVIVRELAALERFLAPAAGQDTGQADVRRLPVDETASDGASAPALAGLQDEEDQQHRQQAAAVGSSMRAVVPPMQSFGRGRRR
ncbi:MAG TPA: DNA polymerase III subunit alpha [Solirubrobacteraceae bacterium]|nr:DNA polymerase III subunit alpha [Solirubrobacteraceae bacterium]